MLTQLTNDYFFSFKNYKLKIHIIDNIKKYTILIQ